MKHDNTMWGAEGLIKAGQMWKPGEWRLTDESIVKILKHLETELKR